MGFSNKEFVLYLNYDMENKYFKSNKWIDNHAGQIISLIEYEYPLADRKNPITSSPPGETLNS